MNFDKIACMKSENSFFSRTEGCQGKTRSNERLRATLKTFLSIPSLLLKSSNPDYSEELELLDTKRQRWMEENKKNPKGSIGMSAEDYNVLGNKAPDCLATNPGKTMADLLTQEQITLYLNDIERQINYCLLNAEADQALSRLILKVNQDDFNNCICFLENTGRLPDGYRKPIKRY